MVLLKRIQKTTERKMIMYIDIHAHAYWKPAPFVTKFFTPEQMIAAQDRVGIEKCVLLPVTPP